MTRRVLAIEWSSSRVSVARSGAGGVEEKLLMLPRFQAEQALPLLEDLVAGASGFDEIRIGRGPGNYSGIRQSLAWAIGYAAPGGTEILTAASGDAQAHRLQGEGAHAFAILGDARRGVWWGKTFPESETGWRLQTPAAWVAELGDCPVFSQEAGRLQDHGLNLQADEPRAGDLLALPAAQLSRDLNPLYLHPAV